MNQIPSVNNGFIDLEVAVRRSSLHAATGDLCILGSDYQPYMYILDLRYSMLGWFINTELINHHGSVAEMCVPANIHKCLHYCWCTKSCTTWDVWNPINNGRNHISTGAGVCPSTVSNMCDGQGCIRLDCLSMCIIILAAPSCTKVEYTHVCHSFILPVDTFNNLYIYIFANGKIL